MSFLLDVSIWCAVAAACVGAWAFLWRHLLPLEDSPDEIHFITTGDGWRLAMGRYRALASDRDPVPTPVVLCHGIGANRYNLDFAPGRSLARHLAERGFDCWVPELRGVGRSERPRFLGRRRYTWSFDTLVEQDVPAILERVLKCSGAAGVHWIGHSLGGLLIYGHLARAGSAGVASVCAIASPGDLRDTARLNKAVLGAIRSLTWWPAMHLRLLGGIFAPLAGMIVSLPSSRAMVNPDNMEGWVARRCFAHLSEDIGQPLLAQFASWALSPPGSIRSVDAQFDYVAGLESVTIPALFVAGSADYTATPEAVLAAFNHWGGEKSLRTFGRQHGDTIDYGHGDLLIGTHAPRDIYPAIEGWLRDGVCAGAQLTAGAVARKAPEPELAAGNGDGSSLPPRAESEPKAASKAKAPGKKRKTRSRKGGKAKKAASATKGP